MEYCEIKFKKPLIKVKAPLKEHLKKYSRACELPITYSDLMRYENLIPVLDQNDEPTLWYSVIYNISEQEEVNKALAQVYERLVSEGEHVSFLKVERIEFCSFGNSNPFRIKIINEINDNHDYFYVKKADASRIYGLELEEIFSPDKVNYLVDRDTLIEEHIIGIPMDEFISKNEGIHIDSRLRLAKEFVKFNERCMVRLLGDMRAYNYVVEITQDFDTVQYRLRAMDFDQQSYEGRFKVYRPQFFKDNLALVQLAQELMSKDVADHYSKTERVAMRKRLGNHLQRFKSLLRRMKKDVISKPDKIKSLSEDLNEFHRTTDFTDLNNMADVLNLHVEKSLGIKILSTK